MPLVTRTGTVLDMSRAGSTRIARIHFVEPPPPEDVLLELSADDYADMRAAKFAGAKVTITYDDAGTPPMPQAVKLP